jgi:hypothetical protein
MSQANETQTPTVTPRPNDMNLVWLDMEMTGLDPDNDRIIEVAVVVTDADLNILAEGPVFAIHQSDETLDKMDNWNKGTHGKSGLIDRVKASTVTEAQAEDLPGPPFHGARHAEAGSLFPLPQPGRVDPEGTVPPLEAGTGLGLQEGAEAYRAGRHRRVHRRAALLPRALY